MSKRVKNYKGKRPKHQWHPSPVTKINEVDKMWARFYASIKKEDTSRVGMMKRLLGI